MNSQHMQLQGCSELKRAGILLIYLLSLSHKVLYGMLYILQLWRSLLHEKTSVLGVYEIEAQEQGNVGSKWMHARPDP